MATTPPAAKVPNDDQGKFQLGVCSPTCLDLMEIDPHPQQTSVAAQGDTRRNGSKTQTPPEAAKRGGSIKSEPVEILEARHDDDEEEDGDGEDEVFAVERVLRHRIGRKSNVRPSPFGRVF